MVFITTFVPLPRRYWPDVTAPAKAFIAVCAVVAPDPPFATASVPDTSVASATCESDILVPLDLSTLFAVCVPDRALSAACWVVWPVPPFAIATVPVTLEAVPVVFWLKVGQVNVPVLKLPDVGVPKAGVTNAGLVDSTTLPDPVEVVTPVPPATTGRVPAARAEALVEYSALFAPANVVKPVPPYPDWIVPPCHVPPEITVDPSAKALVPQVTASGR